MGNTISIPRDEYDYLRQCEKIVKEMDENGSLSAEEKEQLKSSIKKVKAGNTSDFVSWKKAKKELGI